MLAFNQRALARAFREIDGLYEEGLFVLPTLSSLLAVYLQLILPPLTRRPEIDSRLVEELYSLARRFTPTGLRRPLGLFQEGLAYDD